jgi:transmembrane sensor
MDYNALITKFLSGNTNTGEMNHLMDWRKQDPLNEAMFQKLEQAWNNAAVLTESYNPDLKKGWASIQKKSRKNTSHKEVSLMQPWMKVAASLILLAGVTCVMALFIFDGEQKPSASSLAKINLPKKNMIIAEPRYVELQAGDLSAEFVLPDSSHVFLNKNSKITYPEKFEGTERPVYLNGEAFFEVNENKKAPFIIYCADTKTEVSGKSLNVRGYENEDVQVSVISGSVAFSDMRKGSDKKIILAANDVGTFHRHDATMGKTKAKKASWWKKSTLKKGWKNLIRRIKNGVK